MIVTMNTLQDARDVVRVDLDVDEPRTGNGVVRISIGITREREGQSGHESIDWQVAATHADRFGAVLVEAGRRLRAFAAHREVPA